MPVVKTELKAKDVMTTEPVCVSPSTTIRELVRVFEENEISGAPVVDQQGTVVGIVSKTDLIRKCAEGTLDVPPAYLFQVLGEQEGEETVSEVAAEPAVSVEDFMSEDPIMVRPEVSAATVAREMSDNSIHRVIVVDEEKYPMGIITSLDLLRHFSH
jgi:CBS domain-containing protein